MPAKPNPKPAKKLSKQELKSLKKQQKEKKKEEAKRLAEEKKRLAEEEAKRLEEEARIAWEAEQARLKAEQERISCEREALQSFFQWRSCILEDHHTTTANVDDWTRFVEAGDLPHPTNEGDMNNFFHALENSCDKDFDAVLVTVSRIRKVFFTAEDLSLIARQKKNDSVLEERYNNYMKNLESLLQRRIDHTTASLLIRSHEVWKKTNEATFSAMLGGWKIYLWINHAKNPRVRVLTDPKVMITISLPKAFTFSNIAVRVYHQMFDPLLRSRNAYKSVGGIFVLDVLAIPPASRASKGWTFEHVTAMTSSVIHVPFSNDGSLVGLEFPVPETVIISESTPEIGWWNQETETWEKDGISGVEYDKSTRIVKFQTIKTRPHAIIQSRVKYFPHQSWILHPVVEDKAILTLNSLGSTIKIEVGNGCCKLLETPFAECKHIVGEELDPVLLLKRLSRCGLHLMPVDVDSELIQTTIKERKVEEYACEDMALAAPTCVVASSKWNSVAAADSCVVRILEIPELRFPPTFHKSKNIRSILYKAKGNALLQLTEKSTEYAEELDGEFHASILVTLEGVLSQDSLAKLRKGDPRFTECFKYLALSLRLFSFTSTERVKQKNQEVTASSEAAVAEGAVPSSSEGEEKKETASVEGGAVAGAEGGGGGKGAADGTRRDGEGNAKEGREGGGEAQATG